MEGKIVDYLFYSNWNKEKNILPKPNYQIRLYVKLQSKKSSDGWVQNKIDEYERGEIQNLETQEKEEIKSVKIIK